MFDKRLFSLAPGVGRLVAAKVLCQWVGLLANVVFVVTVVVMLSPALAVVESAFDPMFSMGDSGLISAYSSALATADSVRKHTSDACWRSWSVRCCVLMMRAAAYSARKRLSVSTRVT